eukprot:4345980-Prymnesium_polylepis.1
MAVDARSAGVASIGLLEAWSSKWFLAACYAYGEYSVSLSDVAPDVRTIPRDIGAPRPCGVEAAFQRST